MNVYGATKTRLKFWPDQIGGGGLKVWGINISYHLLSLVFMPAIFIGGGLKLGLSSK